MIYFRNVFFIFTCIILLSWEYAHSFSQVNFKKDPKKGEVCGLVKTSKVLNHYIISSEFPAFGRLSNMKTSAIEVIGMALALNRTAILPKFESCLTHPNTVPQVDNGMKGFNDDSSFEQLFDYSFCLETCPGQYLPCTVTRR